MGRSGSQRRGSGRGKRRGSQKSASTTKQGQSTTTNNEKTKSNMRKTTAKHTTSNRGRDSKLSQLPPPIPASIHSIHTPWKKPLGGLIRFYVHAEKASNGRTTIGDVVRRLEAVNMEKEGNISATRDFMLQDLDSTKNQSKQKQPHEDWIDFAMAMECVELEGVPREQHSLSCDGKGFKLKTEQQPGVGPAHIHETWNKVVVPEWAVGQSYFFEVTNRAPVDLACVMTIDGCNVAKNVPIPAKTTRTIRPDARYFDQKWILRPAQRATLEETVQAEKSKGGENGGSNQPHNSQQRRAGIRYNGRRPNYQGRRLSLLEYPDPVAFGWKFTGSAEQSFVEFFEREMNLGTVRLDWYYTTGTVKTVLDHPTSGMNQLFRNRVTPEQYASILRYPRQHTNVGYRRRTMRPPPGRREDVVMGEARDATMEEADQGGDDDENQQANISFYARDDDYDFDRQGHENRVAEMARLQEERTFKVWEKHSRQDHACICAKFYVAKATYKKKVLRKRMDVSNGEEAPPPMKPVVNIKAAEDVHVTTEFVTSGGASEPRNSTNVKMTRVPGLNDNHQWAAGPIFESKLYYRLEAGHNDGGEAEDDEEGQEESGAMQEEETVPLAERLLQETPLDEYKTQKLQQMQQWHSHHRGKVADQAQEMLACCTAQIQNAQTTAIVDQILTGYWKWHQEQHWTTTESTLPGADAY